MKTLKQFLTESESSDIRFISEVDTMKDKLFARVLRKISGEHDMAVTPDEIADEREKLANSRVKERQHFEKSMAKFEKDRSKKKLQKSSLILNKIKESESSDVGSNIRDMFAHKYNVEVGAPNTHTHKSHNSKKVYKVYPVTFYDKQQSHRDLYDKDSRQKYQTYVHHELGSKEIKPGLPKRYGGEVRSVE